MICSYWKVSFSGMFFNHFLLPVKLSGVFKLVFPSIFFPLIRKNILRRTTSGKLKIWQQFCGDISTIFQWLWSRVEISPQNCCLVVNSSYLEFARCCSSEYVFSYILLNCLLVKVLSSFIIWNVLYSQRSDIQRHCCHGLGVEFMRKKQNGPAFVCTQFNFYKITHMPSYCYISLRQRNGEQK